MFSSNQRLVVSNELSTSNICCALRFALSIHYGAELDESEPLGRLSYQITEDGKYCIGEWFIPVNGWSKVEQESLEGIASEICNFLSEQAADNPYKNLNGSSHKAFLMKIIPESLANKDNGIVEPFYGLVSFEPFYSYYSQ